MKRIFLTLVTAIGVTMLSQAQLSTWFTNQAEVMNVDFYKKDLEISQSDTIGNRVSAEMKEEENSFRWVNRRNKVAVMPLMYIGNDHGYRTDEMRFYLQNIAIDYLNESAMELKVLDASEINALLRKNGINEFNP